MSLKPGTVIKEHRDYGQQRYSFERGVIRGHIPVRTHEAVSWKLRGTKISMEAGEARDVNVCMPHSVENNSKIDRVHLVLDIEVKRLGPKVVSHSNRFGQCIQLPRAEF